MRLAEAPRRVIRPLPAMLLALVIAGCAGLGWREPAGPGGGEPRSERGNPPFYEQFGKRYYVLPTAAGYRERGVASWYGRKFHGRPTSSGEIYDMHAMTAAHKTLPLPTRVRVRNLRNGREVIVRVNDRGPFVGERIIDMSYAAALELDMVRDGTAPVEVSVLTDGAPSGTPLRAGLPPGAVAGDAAALAMYLQVGAFGDAGNAEQLRRRLELGGFDNVNVVRVEDGNAAEWRVRLGPVATPAAYDQLVQRVAALDITTTQLITAPAATPEG